MSDKFKNEYFWQQETLALPSYPDLMWSRPENKSIAGKLLIIGGNMHGFASPVHIYEEAKKAGIGAVRVVLPNAAQKLVGKSIPDVSFATANPSGGFSVEALDEILEMSNWADASLLGGNMGNNSETVILVERFLTKKDGLVIIAHDNETMVLNFHDLMLNRTDTILETDIFFLQKLQAKLGDSNPVKSSISLANLAERLHTFTLRYKLSLIINFGEYVLIASGGMVNSTVIFKSIVRQDKLAANCAVWALQNPNKIYEAMSCAILTAQT